MLLIVLTFHCIDKLFPARLFLPAALLVVAIAVIAEDS